MLDGSWTAGLRMPNPPYCTRNGGLAPDVEAIDDEGMLEHAAKAIQCTGCHVLMAVTWARVTSDVLSGESVTAQQVREYMEEACEKDALDAILKKYTLLKMESGGMLFFVVRERRGNNKGSTATDAEEAAVAMSCKNLVRESGQDLTAVAMEQLANYRREALRLLVKHGRDGGNEQEGLPDPEDVPGPARGGAGSGSNGLLPRLDAGSGSDGDDEDDEYVDPDDLDEGGGVKEGGKGAKSGKRPPKPQGSSGARVVRGLTIKADPGQPECTDLNPKCPQWAASGECELNPNYMIGTHVHKGHCRKSCGMCTAYSSLSGSPELVSELESLSAALLLAAKNLGCGASGACLSGVSGMAAGQGLIKQAAGSGGTKEKLLPGMKELPGGFVLGKPWWGIPEVRSVAASLRKPVPGSDGVPPSEGAAASSGAADDGGAAVASAPSHADVDRVLAPALAHRILSVPSDFFIYEYLYKNHTRHYHAEKDGSVTEDWLLGKFSRESVSLMSSATGEVAGLEELDLLPGGTHSERLKAHTWPYVKQVYAGGDECVLGGGRRVVRRVEARVACSPDSNTYMLVREPDFCTYTFVIFVPELCALDYYKPRPKGQTGKVQAAAGGPGAGAGGQGSKRAAKGGARN
ncbi:hypothetical protein GPECTOR_6g739 [Gonium pectorale]|uniref:Uncharacterized protein n=1 Tax=Gonium pectorale TaxID=33097 RepID=A0A150GVF7_GONPE|nr:hypothetical protein GPECTOR_6g739 [Gonium pectorale]|eukprot:KXZ53821.1 hypothetical protein GPECTOR_6g739 [Gonium pectorale]